MLLGQLATQSEVQVDVQLAVTLAPSAFRSPGRGAFSATGAAGCETWAIHSNDYDSGGRVSLFGSENAFF